MPILVHLKKVQKM